MWFFIYIYWISKILIFKGAAVYFVELQDFISFCWVTFRKFPVVRINVFMYCSLCKRTTFFYNLAPIWKLMMNNKNKLWRLNYFILLKLIKIDGKLTIVSFYFLRRCQIRFGQIFSQVQTLKMFLEWFGWLVMMSEVVWNICLKAGE